MTEEQIKQKAEVEADKVVIGSGMDRASVIHLKHLLVTMYMQGATEATKELEAQIEKMKNWCNCKNYQQCLIELAEQGKGMKPSECCVNCKKWEIKEK